MRWPVIILFCLLFSACYSAGKRGGDSALAVYDFGSAPESPLAAPRKHPLALEVRAPLWFDSMGIDYRLAYVDASRLREYARARWAGPPAQLIQQRLLQQLHYSPAGQGQARCILRLDITEFSQVFSSPENSRGVFQGRAVLMDRARRQVAELSLNIEKAAETQDARGGVGAMSASVAQLASDLLAWEHSLSAAGNAGACFD